MDYKYNEDKILEILTPFDSSFRFEEGKLVNYLDESFDLRYKGNIEKIENYIIDSYDDLTINFIIHVLNSHFDECFDKIEEVYDYDKCKQFLENNGFEISPSGEVRILEYDYLAKDEYRNTTIRLKTVVNALNGKLYTVLGGAGNVVYTLLKAHQKELLKEE